MKKNLSIGAKLITIITILVVLSLGTITFLVTLLMGKATQVTTEENNLTITRRAATAAQNEMASIKSNTSMMLDMLQTVGYTSALSRQTALTYFDRNSNVAAVLIPGSRSFFNSKFFLSNEIETSLVSQFLNLHSEDIKKAELGQSLVFNAADIFDLPVLVYLFPWRENGRNEALAIFFTSDSLNETFGTGSANQSYLINHNGDVLIHADFELLKAGMNVSNLELVQKMWENNDDNRQFIFTGLDGKRYFGAYQKLDFADLAVFTTIEYNKALRAVTNQTKQNIYLSLAILFLSILFIFFFSKSLSNPLKKLTAVANEISQGNFNTDLFDLLEDKKKKKRTDEIGVLIQSTKDEREILNTVSRLTNKGVAKAVVRKEIDFNPHLKDITIFFSDIRGFTAISDGFNKRFGEQSAGEIISFLNDYMSRMVNCITISGGNVDKFEGDAIMACWGVLRDDDLSFEKLPDGDPSKAEKEKLHSDHVKRDAINAVRGVLAMRYALMVYNKQAEAFTKAHEGEEFAKYKPHIRIGSGLNSGRATVGFMGSNDKMEFTSIGDAVNLASRTESSNKPCGTDMLITQDTYNILKYDYIKSEENNFTIAPEFKKDEIIVEVIPVTFEVKGKGKQHFYGVVNMPNFNIEEFFKTTDPDFVVDADCECAIGPKGPKTLADVRRLLGIPTPNFGEVNLDAEESKVKAQ